VLPYRIACPRESRFLKDGCHRPAEVFTVRALPILSLALLALGGCAHNRDLDETGGLLVTRSTCPATAIPAYTGDVTLFSPEQSQDARAQDVVATIGNLRPSCDESGPVVRAGVTFDVTARRASPRGARDVVLPYFVTVLRSGTKIMSKQQSQVLVHFADGQLRGTGTAAASATIDKSLATLPGPVVERLNRKRKATDADASIDPMADPRVRAAVNQASFELLVGFQLTDRQLAYNATR